MDNPFPLHKLPALVFRDVADYWSPFELYNYSTLSKKAKANARCINKQPEVIGLTNDECNRVSMFFPNCYPKMKFIVVLKHLQPFNELDDEDEGIFMFDENPASKVLEVLEHVVYIFKLNFIGVNLDSGATNRADFSLMWKAVMNGPLEIRHTVVRCRNVDDLEFTLENYTKKSDVFHLHSDCKPGQPYKLPKHLKFCMAKSTRLQGVDRFMFDLVMSIDIPIIDVFECEATSEEMNSFMKSWQSGLSHSRLQSARFFSESSFELEKVLEGIEVTFRDPRTVKRQFTRGKAKLWIFGGIDINLHDGRTATIQWRRDMIRDENREIPNEWIQEYENAKNGDGFEVVKRRIEGYSINVW